MLHIFRLAIFLFLNCYMVTPAISEPYATQFYSQASQDQFVHLILYTALNKQDVGYYVEIGAGHPMVSNNSYFFEKNLEWKGISLDIDSAYQKMWLSTRKNPLIIEDATQADYSVLLKDFPHIIDYLSLDIDHSYDLVLKKIPVDHIFKVITIEHDFYRFGGVYRDKEREILESLGYYLLCPNVIIFFNGMNCIFEDWWIHPSGFSSDALKGLLSLDLQEKNHQQIITTLQNNL